MFKNGSLSLYILGCDPFFLRKTIASLEDFSLGLFREWGIGSGQENNGVLILVDVGGRQSRIEVGYGLEGALPDGRTGRFQDQYMVPDFAVGDYSLGIKKGFDAIITQVYGEYGYEFEGSEYYPDSGAEDEPGPVPILGIIIVIILIVLDFIFTGGRFTFLILHMLARGGGRRGGGGYRGGGGGSAGGGGSSRGW